MPAVLADPALAALLLLYVLGWGVALGLLYTWNATFHYLFQGIARALTFKIPLRGLPDVHISLGGWANTIDHVAQEWFSSWALGCEIMVGKMWHALGYLFHWQAWLIKRAAIATVEFGHWMHNSYVPERIRAELSPLRNKTNKAAALAAAAAAGLAALKHETRDGARSQARTNKVEKTETKHAAKTAEHAHQQTVVHERTIVHEQKVITQVVDVASLPVPFGRTVHNIRRRLGTVEGLLGATAMAAAMANVLGVPNPRCLTKGPFGRFARALCGVPSNFLNDILGLLADFIILENICTTLPWLESAASEIGTPLVEVLTEVGAGLCRGSTAPAALRGPMPSVPALIFGVSASGV